MIEGVVVCPIVEVGSHFADAKADDCFSILAGLEDVFEALHYCCFHLFLLRLFVLEILSHHFIVLEGTVHFGYEFETGKTALDIFFVVEVVRAFSQEENGKY